MSLINLLFCLVLTCVIPACGQALQFEHVSEAHLKPLDARLEHFDVEDTVFREGISELSLRNIDGLHLGFEEIIREKIQDDPKAVSPHLSLHLQNKTVREVLDELCRSDLRYTWSEDGSSVNIYPRAIAGDESHLLNLRINKITLENIADPDQALIPLSKLFPAQQVGYFGPGLGSNTYAAPWTVTFENITVRQFIDRLAEHIGQQTSWVWEGGKGERMFTFLRGGFHTR